MKQQNKSTVSEQVEYLGRWVDKRFFRVFVYNATETKLAESYNEFIELISSGLWFSTPEAVKEIKKRKRKLSKDESIEKELPLTDSE